MLIDDYKLRQKLSVILEKKTRNQIVLDIKARGISFHQYHIDRFMSGDDVKLSTLKKIDDYVENYRLK
jgi:hypothetical protein